MKNHTTMNPLSAWLAALAAVVCLLLAPGFARASGNLLANGDFNAGNNGDWTTWAWGGGWANFETAGWGSPGGTIHTAFGAAGNGGGGAFQEIGGAAGVEYTLTVLSGADAWWVPTGRMEMFFLNNTNGVITNASMLTVDPAVYGVTNENIPHPWSNYTLVATSPVGTVKIKVELSCNESSFTNFPVSGATGSVGFDDVSLTAPIEPPVISDVIPNGLLVPTNILSFTASSAVGITNVSVLLNGMDVSSSLATNGPLTSLSVSYTGLKSNQTYTAVITVTDSDGLNSFTSVSFDTYAPLFTWEAEDYNFGSGGYINDPTPSDSYNPGVSYFGETGSEGVDFHDYTADGATDYRPIDTMAIETTGDLTRQKFVDASAADYNVGWFNGAGFPGGSANDGIDFYEQSEWVNYTRDFPAGTYNIYGRLANGNGGTATIPLSRVTSDPAFPNQTTLELGVFSFPAIGWGSYAYVPLTDGFGNPVEVTLSGTETLRVTAGSGGNLNFFMLMPVDTEQPTITGVYPDGRTLLQGTNKLTFTASSTSHSIAQSNVVVTLNGADVSSSLSFSGSASTWNVSGPLELGVTNYIAVISVMDDVGNSHSVTVFFDTFDPSSFVVEAEDYNYGGGLFIDNPVITSTNAANSYFDHPLAGERIGVNLSDVYIGDNPELDLGVGQFRYRALDDMRTDICSDTPMQKLLDAQAVDALAFNYNISYMRSNSWLSYKRTYPAGEYNVYGRLASDRVYALPFEEVNGATNLLGHFVGEGRGFNFFDWAPLMDTNGALAKVTLNGEATLRFNTPEGEVNPNSFLFVPAVTVPEELQWSYAGGVLTLSWSNAAFHLQSQTNAPGAGISASWLDYPGGGTSPVNVTVDPSEGSIFFRLSE